MSEICFHPIIMIETPRSTPRPGPPDPWLFADSLCQTNPVITEKGPAFSSRYPREGKTESRFDGRVFGEQAGGVPFGPTYRVNSSWSLAGEPEHCARPGRSGARHFPRPSRPASARATAGVWPCTLTGTSRGPIPGRCRPLHPTWCSRPCAAIPAAGPTAARAIGLPPRRARRPGSADSQPGTRSRTRARRGGWWERSAAHGGRRCGRACRRGAQSLRSRSGSRGAGRG